MSRFFLKFRSSEYRFIQLRFYLLINLLLFIIIICFFFQADDGIRAHCVTGVQTCALPIYHPTMGGVCVRVVSHADLRAGIAGATVGCSGPRVIEAMTGEAGPPGSHTAETAAAAGLLDAEIGRASCRESGAITLRAAPTQAK